MGCNCKKTVDKINEKLGDGEEVVEKSNPLSMIIKFFGQILIALLCGAITIVLIIPMLIYVIVCLMFGKQPHIRIRNFNKYIK